MGRNQNRIREITAAMPEQHRRLTKSDKASARRGAARGRAKHYQGGAPRRGPIRSLDIVPLRQRGGAHIEAGSSGDRALAHLRVNRRPGEEPGPMADMDPGPAPV